MKEVVFGKSYWWSKWKNRRPRWRPREMRVDRHFQDPVGGYRTDDDLKLIDFASSDVVLSVAKLICLAPQGKVY